MKVFCMASCLAVCALVLSLTGCSPKTSARGGEIGEVPGPVDLEAKWSKSTKLMSPSYYISSGYSADELKNVANDYRRKAASLDPGPVAETFSLGMFILGTAAIGVVALTPDKELDKHESSYQTVSGFGLVAQLTGFLSNSVRRDRLGEVQQLLDWAEDLDSYIALIQSRSLQ